MTKEVKIYQIYVWWQEHWTLADDIEYTKEEADEVMKKLRSKLEWKLRLRYVRTETRQMLTVNVKR